MAFDWLPYIFPEQSHHLIGFWRILEQHMPPVGRVLDLGCGKNVNLAKYRTANREVWGTDFQRHPHLEHEDWFRLLQPDGRIPFANGFFDAVTAIWVLEHVVHAREFLAEVDRILKPGGVFIAHSVSGHHYIAWIRRLCGLLPHSINQKIVEWLYDRPHFDTFPTTYRLNTEPQLRWACRPTQLEVEQLDRFADYGYLRHWKMLQYWAARTEVVLEKCAPGWGKVYFTVVMRKKRGDVLPLAA